MGYVYLINAEKTDLYKIGITKRAPEKRLKALQTGSPTKLILINAYQSEYYKQIETILHRMSYPKKYIEDDFEHLLGEWFKFEKRDVEEFIQKCKDIESSYKVIKENSTLDVTKRF